MKSIKDILVERDGLSESEALELIQNAREELQDLLIEGRMEEAENICEEHFGLEPDYLMELI
jgi:hypothetical protein